MRVSAPGENGPVQGEPVHRLTDKRIPSRRDMEEIAWIIPTKRVNGSMGFAAKDDASEAQDDELEIVPAD